MAGLDVGNATTEVVLADAGTARPIAWDRAPTRGRKGSERALLGAVDLLRRVERTSGGEAGLIAVAPQRPVDTLDALVREPEPDTGRLALLAGGSATPGGGGVGVGRPLPVESEPTLEGPVVLVASDPIGFRATVAALERWRAAGAEVVAALLAGDEAVLVSRRNGATLPVVDGVDPRAALACDLIAVEVAEPGRTAQRLADPVALAHLLRLGADEHDHAEAVARRVRGSRDAAVGVRADGAQPSIRAASAGPGADPWVLRSDGTSVHLLEALRDPGAAGPTACGLQEPDGSVRAHAVDDLWGVDLSRLVEEALLRPATGDARSVALAALHAHDDTLVDPASALAEWTGRPAVMVGTETAAARAGALTTPSALADAVVVDIGGGTIDVISGDQHRVLAGAGELLTAATARTLGLGRGQAEWVKRGPCSRVEAPHLALDEDGTRRFLDIPAAAGLVGWLTAPGPAGPLPFERSLAPTEWRSLRLRIKRAVVGDNVARAAAALSGAREVIAVGGPAADEEVLDALAGALPGIVPGRGNVAGVLGHRYAVAYGLVLLAVG